MFSSLHLGNTWCFYHDIRKNAAFSESEAKVQPLDAKNSEFYASEAKDGHVSLTSVEGAPLASLEWAGGTVSLASMGILASLA